MEVNATVAHATGLTQVVSCIRSHKMQWCKNIPLKLMFHNLDPSKKLLSVNPYNFVQPLPPKLPKLVSSPHCSVDTYVC